MKIRKDSSESNIILTNTITKKETPLPGILQNLSIGGDIIWDNSGSVGTENKKVASGYKEKSISISLLLIKDGFKTSYHILQELERLFKDTEESSNKIVNKSTTQDEKVSIMPSYYNIKNTHINKRGINQVCFTNLNSSENNTKDYINISITFEEIVFPTYDQSNVDDIFIEKKPI